MRYFLFFLLSVALLSCSTNDGPPFPYVQPAPDSIPGQIPENQACISTARVMLATCGELYLRVKNGELIYTETYPGNFQLVESQQVLFGFEPVLDALGSACMQETGVCYVKVNCIQEDR